MKVLKVPNGRKSIFRPWQSRSNPIFVDPGPNPTNFLIFGFWDFRIFGFQIPLRFPDPPRGSRPLRVSKNHGVFLVRKRRARSVRSKCRRFHAEIFDMRQKTKDLVFGPPRVTAAATAVAGDEVSSGVQAQSSPRTQGPT